MPGRFHLRRDVRGLGGGLLRVGGFSAAGAVARLRGLRCRFRRGGLRPRGLLQDSSAKVMDTLARPAASAPTVVSKARSNQYAVPGARVSRSVNANAVPALPPVPPGFAPASAAEPN